MKSMFRKPEPTGRKGRGGALLVGLILAMTIISALAAALLAATTGSTSTQLAANQLNRAYYLAESGCVYAKSIIRTNRYAQPSGTFTFGNGDRFVIASSTNAGGHVIVSTGIADYGGSLETRRRITYEITRTDTGGGGTLPLSFDYDEDGELDDTWTVGEGSVTIGSTGPSDNEPALFMKGEIVEVYLNWLQDPDYPFPDLLSAWENNLNLLSYDIQVKTKALTQGGLGDYFMLGLSFRLNVEADSLYGVSFFRAQPLPNDNQTPDWVVALPAAFQALRDGGVYVLLWEQIGGAMALLATEPLPDTSPFTEYTGQNELNIKPWTTTLVNLDERYSGTNGLRENLIAVYLQSTDVYPRNAPVKWQDDTNSFPERLEWDDPVLSVITNDSLTTENFDTELPEEIGLHAFYDSPAQNEQFFDDFAMRLGGSTDGGGEDQQQY